MDRAHCAPRPSFKLHFPFPEIDEAYTSPVNGETIITPRRNREYGETESDRQIPRLLLPRVALHLDHFLLQDCPSGIPSQTSPPQGTRVTKFL